MTPEQRQKNIEVERRIMGVSLKAETDAEIEQAIRDWEDWHRFDYPGTTPLSLWRFRGVHISLSCNDSLNSLEAHVEQWRREPRDFCGDLNHCYEMEHQLDILGLGEAYTEVCVGLFTSCFKSPARLHRCLLRLEPEHKVDAALRVIEQAEKAGAS